MNLLVGCEEKKVQKQKKDIDKLWLLLSTVVIQKTPAQFLHYLEWI